MGRTHLTIPETKNISSMAPLTAAEFSHHALACAKRHPVIKAVAVDIQDNLIVKIRFTVSTANFIDLFYNSDTQTTAYTLIQNKKRVFGADNTGGWHLHPKTNPDSHRPLKIPISLADFLKSAINS